MEAYLEIILFILCPILLAIILNQTANKKNIGNGRIVAYKLFQFAVILAIASQIDVGIYGNQNVTIAFQVIGYVFLFLLVLDLFIIYSHHTNPNKIMRIQNTVLIIVGVMFFSNILMHYVSLQKTPKSEVPGETLTNPWNTMNPAQQIKLLWNDRVLPKTPPHDMTVVVPWDTASTFNLFHTKGAASAPQTAPQTAFAEP